jgi:hypothetical protein
MAKYKVGQELLPPDYLLSYGKKWTIKKVSSFQYFFSSNENHYIFTGNIENIDKEKFTLVEKNNQLEFDF